MDTSREKGFGHGALANGDEQVSAKLSSRKKVKKKKQKSGPDVLEKSEKDLSLPQEVGSAMPSKMVDYENNHLKIDLSFPEKREGKKNSEHDVLGKSVKDRKFSRKVMTVLPKQDPCPPSVDNFIQKKGTESDQVNAESCPSSKKKRKRKKQERGNDILDKSDKDQKEKVVFVQPNRDQCPSSNEFNTKVDAESDHGTAELSLSKKKRKKRKKQDDDLDKSDKDHKEDVITVQPKTDLLLQSHANKSLELEDTVKNCVQEVENTSGVEAVQARGDLHPPSSTDFNKKMDTESDQVNAESSTSNKKKRKRKKQQTRDNIIEKSEKDHDMADEVVAVRPNKSLELEDTVKNCVQKVENTLRVEAVQARGDLHPPSSTDFNKKIDIESDQVNAESSTSIKKKRKRKKQQTRDNIIEKSEKDHDMADEVVAVRPNKSLELEDTVKNCVQEVENTLGVEAVQARGDLHPPSSTDFNKKMDTESDQVDAESSTSNKKKRKRKKQQMRDNIIEKSEKDHDTAYEVVAVRSNKSLELEDTVKNCVQKVENTFGVEAVQARGDLHPPSSTDFNKKMDTESDQVNAESSTSNKKKRKRKKQQTRDNIIEKSETDMADEVVAVRPNKDLYPSFSNDFIKKTDAGSDQVNADSNLPTKRKTKKNKQKIGDNVPNKSDNVPIPDVASSPKKLVILDINGLLVEIVPYGGNRAYKPDTTISGKAVFKRPFCDDFLQFCFERFDVAVWSSRTKGNLDMAVKLLLGDYRHKLKFCWDQSHCTRTKFYTLDNKQKPLVLKELKKVWEKMDPKISWKKGAYNESNTLLIDDSPYKALRNPAYTAIFPHPYQHTDASDASLGPGGDLRVYLEGLSKADNTQKYVEENPFGQETIKDTDPQWHFYSKIL